MTKEDDPAPSMPSERNSGETESAHRPEAHTDPQNITMIDVINTIANRADPLIQLARSWGEHNVEVRQTERNYQSRMTLTVVGLVVFVVLVAAVLTYLDKMAGSTLSFLLGLTIGYVLTFVRNAIHPEQQA